MVNTHNAYHKDRSTKTFKVSLSHHSNGPWTRVLQETLSDSRRASDPLPLLEFSITPKEARFVKFEMLSYYGHGGGLQYFAASDACEKGWTYYAHTGKCYQFTSDRQSTWDDADKKCKSKGGYLASILDEQTNTFLTSMITAKRAFIGGYRKDEKSWAWKDGSFWGYTNWAEGEPNNSGLLETFAELYADGTWNDIPLNLDDTHGYLCQR